MEKNFAVLISLIIYQGWNANGKIHVRFWISLLIGVIVVIILNSVFKKLIRVFKKIKATHELSDYYNDSTINAARKFYVQTKSQNYPPNYEEEPGFDSGNIFKENLMDFFINRTFSKEKKKDRFYLVLADSGMGKTTFIINLYLKYMSFWNFKRTYKMKVFDLGSKYVLEKIGKIKENEAEHTILLLDAFNEDKMFHQPDYAEWLSNQKYFESRLCEVIEVARNFHKVIITSRTQYFHGLEAEPYEIRIQTCGEKGFYTLEKVYLSPLDDNEIKKYINRKYGVLRFWNRKKKKIAQNIVKRSPRLMTRPMLLNYIDLLLEDNRAVGNIYEIYEILVEQWIEREVEKDRYEKEYEKFKEDLRKYSRLVAIEIFKHRTQTNNLSLTRAEVLDIAKSNNISLSSYEMIGQSLLTYNEEGNWKFAHRSIFEFMIAREIIENIGSLVKLNLEGMDMTKQFLKEKHWEFTFIGGGIFLMGSPENEAGRRDDEKQHPVRVSDFFMSRYPVTIEQFEIFMDEEKYESVEYKTWRDYASTHGEYEKEYPVLHVTWNDAKEYCKWLSEKLNVEVRLPTEAEWEYACRASTLTPFNTGENLTTEQANYDGTYPYNNNPRGNFIGKTTSVGNYPPNTWGLYDMHGNVWEWCEDLYSENYYNECETRGTVENPVGATAGLFRVLRGGSWDYGASYCRSAFRYRYRQDQDSHSNFIGFRVVICIS